MKGRDLSTAFGLIIDGGNGSAIGAFSGAVTGIVVMLLPNFISRGFYSGLCFWMVIIGLIGAVIGAIGGAVMSSVGRRIASRILGPDKEGVGIVTGGLVGGIASWAILYLYFVFTI